MMDPKVIQLIQKLADAPGASGFEDAVVNAANAGIVFAAYCGKGE